ncbi:DUF5017 domain-containing protein [Chitinophaga barathri]|uniref:DUF5017 domain-containing protein n=1 Tax=Chitinophaga barathri TaxID=1647451 RepID=A0A3N4MF04_9BACT|nr:DUF5017 domain-containing protein [Chitinophaga barathri]RPD38670.1 DUF5017 domain-containing protein [Chitinophaga barathri]
MFKYKNMLPLAAISLLFACKRDVVELPAFEARAEKAEYKAGDSVLFFFSGEPDIITFYSGEPGKEYRYKDRTDMEAGVTQLEFISRVLYGSQANNLKVVASNEFTGIYDSANVKKSSWVDITSRFTLATAPGGGLSANTPSGKADLSDLVVKGKPLYLGFQYLGEKPPGATPTQRTWRILGFSLTSTLPGGSPNTLVNHVSAGWLAIDVINKANKWAVAADNIQFAPNGTLEVSEDWMITKPIWVTKVAPDKGTAIKDYSKRKESYSYVFAKPGTYTVTFVGSNTSSKEIKTVVKEITLTIVP